MRHRLHWPMLTDLRRVVARFEPIAEANWPEVVFGPGSTLSEHWPHLPIDLAARFPLIQADMKAPP